MLDDGNVVCEEVSASWMSNVVSVTSSKDVSSSSSTERSGTVGVASGAVSGGMLSALSFASGSFRGKCVYAGIAVVSRNESGVCKACVGKEGYIGRWRRVVNGSLVILRYRIVL